MSSKIQPVILLGGAGTRLWPLSRKATPKQFHALTGQRSMFQETVTRLQDAPAALAERILNPIIVGSAQHEVLALAQLKEIGVEPAGIVCEPFGRNTAPAFAAAAALMDEVAPGALMLLLPADHHIADVPAFHGALERAADAAEDGNLVTFGILPDRPETGYGYIRKGPALSSVDGVSEVAAFVEKPDRPTAEAYLASGDYLWNSGMFVFHVGTAMDELQSNAPGIVSAVREAVDRAERAGTTLILNSDAFDTCPSDSIDYAVMEKTKRACVVPSSIGWSDVGSFETLWTMGPQDGANNKVNGDVVTHSTSNSYIDARSRLVATYGVDGLVIVETSDAVLVAQKEKIGDVKKLIDQMKAHGRPELDG